MVAADVDADARVRRRSARHHVEVPVTVEVRRLAAQRYQVAPYPFRSAPLVLTVDGRWITPQPPGTAMPAALAAAPRGVETITLVPPEVA